MIFQFPIALLGRLWHNDANIMKEVIFMPDVSTRIREAIALLDVSYGELAKATGLPKSTLQRYATGTTEKIPIDRLELIANALNVPTEFFLGWEPKEPIHKDSKELSKFVGLYSKLSPGHRRLIQAAMERLAEDGE
jgi:transcriptional regulator with XRE-family HTH domain